MVVTKRIKSIYEKVRGTLPKRTKHYFAKYLLPASIIPIIGYIGPNIYKPHKTLEHRPIAEIEMVAYTPKEQKVAYIPK